jgi:hypothetical protein
MSIAAMVAPAAWAGPPFLTDDPEPTDVNRWEIYGPFLEAEGREGDLAGAAGVELNFGVAEDWQLTVGLPASYARDDGNWQWGAGDLEVSAKFRFYHREDVSIAVFPGLSLPTGSNGMSGGEVTALLPIWAQKNVGQWSIFGGGGYAINPGAGNRDYLTGGVAVTRSYSERLMMGIEVDRQGADTEGGSASTSLGVGAILDFEGPFRLLGSAGPTFDDAGGSVGFHAFIALGMDF